MAKHHLSEVVRKSPKESLSKFFERSPLRDIEIDLVRVKGEGRDKTVTLKLELLLDTIVDRSNKAFHAHESYC